MAKHVIKKLSSGVWEIYRINPISNRREPVGRSSSQTKAEYSAKVREEAGIKCHSSR